MTAPDGSGELRRLVDSILIPHGAFEEGLRRMEQCRAYVAGGGSEPVCLAIVGESRTGKTRCAEVFRWRHAPTRMAEGVCCTVLCTVVPSRPTVKSIAELLLKELGAADWHRGTENEKTSRLTVLMRGCSVRMLVLDEFHHFYDKGSHKVQHHVADWLKNVVAETQVALVVSGLPTLQFVIDQNEQLAGRFLSAVRMPRFDWLDAHEREEWLGILGAFAEGMSPAFDLPALDGQEMALRMYCATGGLIGYVTILLRQAVWNAVDASSKRITLGDLAAAHAHAIWSKERFASLPSPFDVKRSPQPSADLIAQSKLLDTPAPAPPRSRGAAPRAGTPLAAPAAGKVLVG